MDVQALPGTTRLLDDGAVVLNPAPTPSPNDPLNWSWSRKAWHAALVCYIAGFTAATSNDGSSAQFGELTDLGISYTASNTAAGVLFVGIAFATFALSPWAWLWGRRGPYLVCIACGLAGALWMGATHTVVDAVLCQLLVGMSEACAEANVQLSLSDLYFEHQRGAVIGLYMLATSVGTYLGPLVAGYISDSSSMGWRWIGWWGAIISGVTLAVLYFGLEETMFEREGAGAITGIGATDAEKGVAAANSTNVPLDPESPKPYFQRIRLLTPADNVRGWGFRQYISRLVHTLRIFSFPAVIFSGLQWGFQDAWLTFYLTVEDDNWSEPPWNYGDAAVGLMNVPCIIGAVLGCTYGGWLSDRFVLWVAHRWRSGVSEAEDRLWLLLPLAISNPAGLVLFGVGTARGWDWPAPYVGLGLIGFGWGCTGDLAMAYLMDAYPGMVLEGMVGVAVVNNLLACLFTFVAGNWLDAQGVGLTFIVIAAVECVVVLTTVPMLMWGKACRVWTRGRYETFLRIRDAL